MPARSTPHSVTGADESLVPHLSAAARLLDECATAFSTALVSSPDLLIWEDVREVSLTLAALERVLAAFAGAALAIISPQSLAAQRHDGILSLVVDLEAFPEKTWKLLPSGGIATLLCQTVDLCEVVVLAMRTLVAAGAAGCGMSTWWARRCAHAKLRVSGSQLAVTLRLVVLATSTVGTPVAELPLTLDVSTKVNSRAAPPSPARASAAALSTATTVAGIVGSDVAAVTGITSAPPSPIHRRLTLAVPATPPLRRSRSFTLLTTEITPTSLIERKSIARRLLETTLLPRAAVVWPTLSREANNVHASIERLHAAAWHADPWRLSASPTAQLLELPVLALAYVFYCLAPRTWASEVFDTLIASPQPQLMLHLWRLSSMPLLRAASWALRAVPTIEKRTAVIAGVRTTILSRRGRGLDATMLADTSVTAVDVWPHARDWMGSEGSAGLPMGSPGAEARTPSRRLPPVILWLHGGGFIAEEVGFEVAELSRFLEKSDVEDCTLFYPFYALAQPFPRALCDVAAVFSWLRSRTSRIAIVGESAGGTLAASLCNSLAAVKTPQPAGVVLIYAPLTLELQESSSRLMHLSDPLVPFPVLKALSSMYCGADSLGEDIAPGMVHPLQAPDAILRLWPPTHLLVGGLDPLLDDSCDLRTRLRRLGVQGSLTVYRRLPHAFFALRGVLPDAVDAIDDALARVGDIIGEGLGWS